MGAIVPVHRSILVFLWTTPAALNCPVSLIKLNHPERSDPYYIVRLSRMKKGQRIGLLFRNFPDLLVSTWPAERM